MQADMVRYRCPREALCQNVRLAVEERLGYTMHSIHDAPIVA